MVKKVIIIIISLLCPIFVFAADKVDINSATITQLDEIVHVGVKTAQKIIDARPYNSVQDLSRVKGIGNGKDLQDIISQGVACVNCQTTQENLNAQNPNANQTPSPQIQNTATPTPTVSPSPTPAVIYPAGVFINEILPNPKGADETDEWIVPTIQQTASVCS